MNRLTIRVNRYTQMVNASVVQVYWEQFGYIIPSMYTGMEEPKAISTLYHYKTGRDFR